MADMIDTVYNTPQEVLNRALEAVGKTLLQIDETGRLANGNNKGGRGQAMEESWFHVQPNSRPEPDFMPAEVELKVTAYKQNKNGSLSAKERLVCNIIDYIEEDKIENFDESTFWKKCKQMCIMLYLWKVKAEMANSTIDKAFIFKFPDEDLVFIRQDREIIMARIRNGTMHQFRERETKYLTACPKGANKKSLREQPHSNIKAMQRAYALKTAYMTQVIRYAFSSDKPECIVDNPSMIGSRTIEDIITERCSEYVHKTVSELKEIFNIDIDSYQLNQMLFSRMLRLNGDISEADEVMKSGIMVKTVRITRLKDGKETIKESMSFPAFRFKELIDEDWEDSDLCDRISSREFAFIIFREDDNGEMRFDGIKFWYAPDEDIEEAKRVWRRTVTVIKKGVSLVKTTNSKGQTVIQNDFPKAKESYMLHVRPHATKAGYKLGNGEIIGDIRYANELPDGRMMTDQCFFLNHSYILKAINS